MEFLQNYNSESSSDSDNTKELSSRQLRSVYLITYSQADLTKFPSRETFAEAVTQKFGSNPGIDVVNWVCCMEKHQRKGEHYHLALKLNKVKRWLTIKQQFQREFNVVLNFSDGHPNYYSAYKYVTKTDKDFIQSANHPDLQNEPRTTQASQKRVHNSASTDTAKRSKFKRLTNSDVSNIIRTKSVKTIQQLYALSETQREEGKMDLYSFLINRSEKKICELLKMSWDIANSQENIKREEKSRLEILNDYLSNCECGWYAAALQILCRNNIPLEVFSKSMKNLLKDGRGKYRNILIVGPANCGKTFILKPLVEVDRCFVNPASSNFAWVGVEHCEAICLNDFRWSQQVIPWHDFLLLLEGETVHLAAPKTHYAQDITLAADVPIFGTSCSEIKFGSGRGDYVRETEVMAVRWNVMKFHYVLTEEEQKVIPPCKHCFAKLVLQ